MAYTSVGSIEPDPMIERILLLKQEAYVYKIPPAQVLMNVYLHAYASPRKLEFLKPCIIFWEALKSFIEVLKCLATGIKEVPYFLK